jgi:hypothetical protein
MNREVKKIYDFFIEEKHTSDLIHGKVYCSFVHTTSYEKRVEAAAAVYFFYKGQIPSKKLCKHLFIGLDDFSVHVAKIIDPKYKKCNPFVKRELSDLILDSIRPIMGDELTISFVNLISRGWDEVVIEYHKVFNSPPPDSSDIVMNEGGI